jgi:hypothetical protein
MPRYGFTENHAYRFELNDSSLSKNSTRYLRCVKLQVVSNLYAYFRRRIADTGLALDLHWIEK